jgi:plasmid stability protein
MISSCNHGRWGDIVGQVIIRNIDDRVLERLKARAMAQRKSLEQSLRDLLTEAAKPSRAELLADLERIRAMTPPRKPDATYPTAEELIREDRDAR